MKGLAPGHIAHTQDGTTFYWPETSDPRLWEGFRAPSDDAESKRPIEEICFEEMGNIAFFILSEHGSTSREDLARSACRLFGTARTTAEAEKRIYQALAHGRAGERISVESGVATALSV